jgi:hypothetical protein
LKVIEICIYQDLQYSIIMKYYLVPFFLIIWVFILTGCFGTSSDPVLIEICGNGDIEGKEECDLDNLLETSCDVVFPGTSGSISCGSDCLFDTSKCIACSCGDGSRRCEEACDGQDLNGATCNDLGYAWGGTLACKNDCTFDETDCVAD